MRVLVVEDDEKSATYLIRALRESGMVADRAVDGELGLALALEGIYDLLIVDRLLPKLDGLDLVKELRRTDERIPILMLSALGSSPDRVEGLKAGCDDYLAKPYAFRELVARVTALSRRTMRSGEDGVLDVGAVTLNVAQRLVKIGDRTVALQFREVLLLKLLMQNAGKVVTRSMLIEAAWNYDFEPRGNIIDMHIHRIRKKIDAAGFPSVIETVAGVGYIFPQPVTDRL